ncbi:Metallo-dependent phosphatase [Gonapodya prolifera JEL478]|uniref:Metallo-dependent phosphatase n=1 Tax=Gonapodya prolifera (strain JEL478) TaxID=1344416 RepID=A0A139AJF8_GONPJ|nr:Metallo-dependent phosphatase [Gonapodya prolifera JEL478]|eukprot:KXS16927.1 Metallo-dependent phosphatase [Gonapodya prolifera JEL478]
MATADITPCSYYMYDHSDPSSLPPKPDGVTRFVVISDTRSKFPEVPPGDVLLHTGDFTLRGLRTEVKQFRVWLDSLTHFRYKFILPGNHDLPFDDTFYPLKWHHRQKVYEDPSPTVAILSSIKARSRGVHLLRDNWIEVDGWKVYGTPWIPTSLDKVSTWAFMLPRGEQLRSKYDPVINAALPPNPSSTPAPAPASFERPVDILLTHTPPHMILDRTSKGRNVGCEALSEVVETARPRVHCFGHIHESYGAVEQNGTLFVNSSYLDRQGNPSHCPIVIDLGPRS